MVLFLLDKVLLDESEDGLVGDLGLVVEVVVVVEVDAGEAVVSFWPKPKRRASQEEEPLAEVEEDGDDDTDVVVVVAVAAAGVDREVVVEWSSSLQNKEGGFLGLSSIIFSSFEDFTKKKLAKDLDIGLLKGLINKGNGC